MSKSKGKQTTNREMGVQYGRALIQPTTIDIEAREVDVVFATETLVQRFGWEEDYNEVLVCEAGAIRMERANKGLPVLDCHNSYSVFNQLGRSIKVWINENREVCARIRLSSSNNAVQLFRDIQDGIVTDISVGYQVYKFERIDNGVGQLPTYRAIDWGANEISFAPVPADINSGVRTGEVKKHKVEIITKRTSITSKPMKKKRTTEEGKTVQYTVEDEAVKAGDIITSGEIKGVALTDGEVGDTITLTLIDNEGGEADEGAIAAAEDAAAAAENAATAADDAAAAAEDAAVAASAAATAAEELAGSTAPDEEARKRVATIKQIVRSAGLSADYALGLVGSKLTIDQCRTAVLRRLSKNQTVRVNGSHGVSIGLDAITKKRSAVSNAILHRVAPNMFKLDSGGREYRGMTLVELGKELLHERGVNVRGLSKNDVANHFFGRSHSTSDFPLLFEGVIDKLLRAQYEFAPEYWDMIARQTSVTDFRAKGLYQVGSKNGMKKVAEGAEIKYTTLVESKQSIKVESYAEGIMFTRQAFVNDDLGAFQIIPSNFVKDWDELRGSLIWSLITENVKMEDGQNLFSANHKNLLTGANSTLSEASLSVAKTLLGRQQGIDGRTIRVLPKYLVVSPENEIAARKIVTATTPATSDDVNVFANAFDVIVEPRLTDPTAWYMMADPYAVDSLYYAYLEGNKTLRVNSEEDFNTDTMKYAVRGDFGAQAIDYRGMIMSKGKA